MKISLSKVLLFLIPIIIFSGCSPKEKAQVESSTMRKYKIVEVKRPKHFRVKLQDEHGNIKQVSVSKHCNRWREVQLGSEVMLPTITYVTSQKKWTEINAKSVCPGK